MPKGKPGLVQKTRAVPIPDELWERAGRVAERTEVSRAELVRDGLERELNIVERKLQRRRK